MADIMMQLGAYQFSINTAAYQELKRSNAYSWAAQERFGKPEALQYTGPGSETLSLDGVIFPGFKAGRGQLEAMRREAAKGEPLQLVDGLGHIHGQWVVERIDETQSRFAQKGVPLRQTFSLQLRKYDNGPSVSNA